MARFRILTTVLVLLSTLLSSAWAADHGGVDPHHDAVVASDHADGGEIPCCDDPGDVASDCHVTPALIPGATADGFSRALVRAWRPAQVPVLSGITPSGTLDPPRQG